MRGIGWILIVLGLGVALWSFTVTTTVHTDATYLAGLGYQEAKDTYIRTISTEDDRAWGQSQLKSLDTLKRVMAKEVKKAGGNAVIRFTYGQRNTFWRSLFSMDDVWWHASGVIAKVTEGALKSST